MLRSWFLSHPYLCPHILWHCRVSYMYPCMSLSWLLHCIGTALQRPVDIWILRALCRRSYSGMEIFAVLLWKSVIHQQICSWQCRYDMAALFFVCFVLFLFVFCPLNKYFFITEWKMYFCLLKWLSLSPVSIKKLISVLFFVLPSFCSVNQPEHRLNKSKVIFDSLLHRSQEWNS